MNSVFCAKTVQVAENMRRKEKKEKLTIAFEETSEVKFKILSVISAAKHMALVE